MGWAKFDDKRHQNPKIRRVGLEASGLDCHGITYAAAMETDGFLDENVVEMLAGVKHWRKIVAKLVVENRWERDNERGGWWIHDYLEFNPSRDEIAAQREAWSSRAKAGASARWGKADARKHGKSDASSMQEALTKQRESNAPTRPVPSHTVINKEVKTSLGEQGKHEEAQNLSKVPAETTLEHLGVDKTESKTASGENTKPRKRDLLFDAMAEACGHDLTQLTKSSAAAIAKATSEIRPICKTPDEVWEKAAIYKKLHPDWVLTPSALAKYWSSLTLEQVDNQGSDKYRVHREFEAEILAKLARENPTASVDALRSPILAETSEEVGIYTPIHKPAPERPKAPSPSKRIFEESGEDDELDNFEDYEDRDTYEPDDWEDDRAFGDEYDA